jgi:AraC-like DNA-binding protein
MLYRSWFPKPPLAAFVHQLWLYQGAVNVTHAKERLLPDGSMELVIDLREDRIRIYDRDDPERFESRRGSVLIGAHSNFFVIDTESQASVMGVHFRPGGAFPFVGRRPAGELHNLHVSLQDLWGAEASFLRERLLATPSPEEKFRIVEQALTARAACPLAHHPAVSFALQQLDNGARPVGSVLERIGLSQRRFIQLFTTQVGLTPKLFCRVRRFQRVLRRIRGHRDFDWIDVALACGYFDQSHLIHDFQAFSGMTPTAYMTARTEHLNHVPIV